MGICITGQRPLAMLHEIILFDSALVNVVPQILIENVIGQLNRAQVVVCAWLVAFISFCCGASSSADRLILVFDTAAFGHLVVRISCSVVCKLTSFSLSSLHYPSKRLMDTIIHHQAKIMVFRQVLHVPCFDGVLEVVILSSRVPKGIFDASL